MGLTGSAKERYEFYKQRYLNCTYVEGNLELTHLEEKNDYNLDFLNQIEEVTGYILIAVVHADVVPLTSLRIIRGFTLYHVAKDSMSYSLYVVTNYRQYNDTMRSHNVGLKELQMRSLVGRFLRTIHCFESNFFK